MPKLSYNQQLTELERTLASVRSNAGRFPPLALAVADDLERFIAEIKEVKLRQQALLSTSPASGETRSTSGRSRRRVGEPPAATG